MTLHWQSRDYVIQDRQSGRSEVGRICYRQLLARQLGVKRHLSLPARPHFHTVHNHDDHGDDDDDSTNAMMLMRLTRSHTAGRVAGMEPRVPF